VTGSVMHDRLRVLLEYHGTTLYRAYTTDPTSQLRPVAS